MSTKNRSHIINLKEGQINIDLDNLKRKKIWKVFKIVTISILSIAVILFLIIFVLFPVAFMLSKNIQRLTMFTNFFLLDKQSDFEKYIEHDMRNIYISVTSENEVLSLGTYHVLPQILTNNSDIDNNFNFDFLLENGNVSVLLYFHGSGEDRSDSLEKYNVLKLFFHVIAFDYRDFGDSSSAILSEDAIVEDSLQIYEWIRSRTEVDVYFWGHSLGTALSTKVTSKLNSLGIFVKGLILEAPFTSMREEIPVHPYGKIFSWMPWFELTVQKPLEKNGFLFKTDKYILNVDCPIMILHAEDDSVIPYTLGKKLYEIVQNHRNETPGKSITFHLFGAKNGYDHFYIYKDKNLPSFIQNFIQETQNIL